jgi:putative FmdB family regulatory protein
MPTYEYECQQCHERVEAVQKFTDPSLTVCPLCGGELRKVFSAVGIVFKGSGFYKNDSRGASSSAEPAKTESTSSSASTTPASTTPPATPTSTTSATTPTPSSSSD